MSELKFPCPKCGQHLEGDESFRGQTVECPACHTQITVPSGPKKTVSPPAPKPSRPPTPPTASRPKATSNKAGIVIALVIGIGIGYGVGVTRNQPTTAPSRAQGSANKTESPAPSAPQTLVARQEAPREVTGRPRRLSKEEWWEKFKADGLCYRVGYNGQAGSGEKGFCKKEEFIRTMGTPDRTQNIGDRTYWYYTCSDGQIQMSLYRGNLEPAYGGNVIVDSVNDY